MEPSPKFWDRMADRYAKKPVADEAAYQKKLQVTRQYLRPDMQVLELGCGTGSTALLHGPYVKHVHGTDISRRMIEIAQQKAEAQGITNVTFEQSSVEELSAPDESFDAVFALSLLHLLEDKEAAMAKIHRLLKPGGLFVSSTACLGDSMKFFKYVGPIGRRLGLIPLVKVFTEDELTRGVIDAGFEVHHQWRPGRGKAVFIVAVKMA